MADGAGGPGADRARGLPGLGELVRNQRNAKGISLRELARRLGVSPSLVSRIENGTAQPSVTTLYGLTAELELSLDELTARPGAGRPSGNVVVRSDERPTLDVGDGVVMELLSDPRDPATELLSITYEPGAASSEDGTLVTHAGHETGLVLSGVLDVTLDGTTHRLAAGDSITFDSSTPHLFRCVGEEPVRAVWMNVGRNTGGSGRVPGPSAH